MKILFIDSAHPSLKKELERNNFICEEDFTSSKSEIEKKISSYQGIILRSRFDIDKKFIDATTNLKFIARVGAGMEHIDVAYAERKGIKCLSSPEGNSNAVAEHALGMLLSLLNNICKANNEVKEGKWIREGNRGAELEGKTIGIYGYGNTGSAFAKLLCGFDVKILAYDKYKKEYGDKGNNGIGKIKEANPKEIFSQADVLSLHLPLTDETKFLVNDSFINKFKKNIYLINTSRGQIVKTDDLVRNLRSGKILGACLDVIEYEESSFEGIKSAIRNPQSAIWNYLISSPKVILSPHIAGWSIESSEKMAKILAEKIIAISK
ncbi:MAG: hydroxyacid dehydrogenase [Bacteroidetes bacterium]|nr:hydroxyacid dehydrogenase [Bacteroidota bacterium]